MKGALAVLAGLLAALQAQAAVAQAVRFVACPVYRDTDAGRKSGCWLADEYETGRRFDVSRAPGLPDWNFEILVEGEAAAAQDDACGGVVLDPVRVSVLPGSCPRHMLPAEGHAGRVFVLPERTVRPLAQPRPAFIGARENRRFAVMFDFNRAFMVYQLSDYLFDEAAAYILAVAPRRVIVTGHAATEPVLVSERELAEDPGLATARAELVREALVRMGVPAELIETRAQLRAQPAAVPGADGLAEPSRRRADIEVVVTP